MKSEHAWLRALAPSLGASCPSLLVGIGDDAAALVPPTDPIVLTVDAAVEGVHFTRQIASLEDIGYRSFMAAASDLAAMAARPVAALSSLTLPPRFTEQELEQLVAGQRLAAALIGLPIVGGNLSRGGLLSVSTTALGACPSPRLRSSARPGDRLWLAGPVGLAAAGLRALLRGLPTHAPALRACVEAWRRPLARVEIGLRLSSLPCALIDVSDGLAQDAGHIALASGVRLILDADQVLKESGSSLQEASALLGEDPGALALAGGEDYALLAASSAELAPLGFVPIGQVEAGEPGVVVLRGGAPWEPPAGFDHGEGSEP
ncbi:MAG: thiamine-phosphate kinase [Polyangiaceae bacterium]|nr:thiamine-phosphate kinase [Polyangiaceae bacterium]